MDNGRVRRSGGSRRRRHTRRKKGQEEDVTVESEDQRVKPGRTRRKTGRALSQEVAGALEEFVKDVKEIGCKSFMKTPLSAPCALYRQDSDNRLVLQVTVLPVDLEGNCWNQIHPGDQQKTLRKIIYKNEGLSGMRKEFAELRSYVAPNANQITAFKANPTKNRYQDVPCIDETRLVLTLNVPPETDYIHANTIKMDGVDKQYIAAQGPLEETISDFWRMIHQESINTIIMLCKTCEDSKQKCAQYWPEVGGENKTYGSMFVMNKKTEHEDRFETYVLEVLPEGCSNSTLVKLIQMTDWPSRGVPQSGFTVLRLLRMIPLGAATVVHCSAGVGRTGTIIAIDTILARLWKSQRIKVPEIVKEMRKQRAMMVQSEAQYVFIYCTVLDYIQAKQPNKYREYVHTFHEEVRNAEMI